MFVVVMEIGGGFYNTWSENDGRPVIFETFEDAVVELAEFYEDYRKEISEEPDNFRIVEVTHQYQHWHDGGRPANLG
jgi:Fe-S-cluster formation regulator IscX/YfhJ